MYLNKILFGGVTFQYCVSQDCFPVWERVCISGGLRANEIYKVIRREMILQTELRKMDVRVRNTKDQTNKIEKIGCYGEKHKGPE